MPKNNWPKVPSAFGFSLEKYPKTAPAESPGEIKNPLSSPVSKRNVGPISDESPKQKQSSWYDKTASPSA